MKKEFIFRSSIGAEKFLERVGLPSLEIKRVLKEGGEFLAPFFKRAMSLFGVYLDPEDGTVKIEVEAL